MADRTSQPSTLVGVNAIFAASARFLWNAAVPNKNSLNNADSTSGLKGTDNTDGAGQKYRTFGADGPMTFACTLPAGAYTMVIVHRMPNPSVGGATLVSTLSGSGFVYEPYTSAGGQYHPYTHGGPGGGTLTPSPVGLAFNNVAWVEVIAFTGPGGSPANQVRRYRKHNDGSLVATTDTLAFNSPAEATIYLGSLLNALTQGLSDLLIVNGDVGDTECLALRANPYRMYAEEGVADTTQPDITSTGTGATNGPFAVNVAENAAGAFITLNANENVTWGALGGTHAAAFEKVNETATSVQIRPVTPFNFDSGLGANPKTFTVQATDTATPANSRTVTVNATVTDVNEPPVFSGTISIPTLTQGVPMTPIALAPFWTDPEGNSLSYALAGAAWPAGLSVVSGQLQGTPSVNGSFTSRSITANDGTNPAVPSNTFTITINAGGDTTIPTLTGSVTVSALTQTSYTLSWPAGSDNVAVTSYERSLDGGATWVDVGNVLTVNITGRTPGSTDQVRVRAKDAAGNVSTPPLSASVVLPTYSATFGPFGNNTGLGQRPAGQQFEGWLFPGVRIGQSLAGVTPVVFSGTLNGSGLAVVTGITVPGACEAQFYFPNDTGEKGTARTQGTAA